MAAKARLRGLHSAAIAAVALLMLPMTGGCAGRGRSAQGPPDATITPSTSSAPSTERSAADALVTDKPEAYARFAAAVALDLEAVRLEDVYRYQQMSTGVRQASLLRDAKAMRAAAISALDNALALDPAAAPVMRKKGEILMEAGNVEEAIELFAQADTVAPAEASWYFRTSGQLELGNRLNDAARLLESALAAAPGMRNELKRLAWVELGSLYVRLERLSDAEKAYKNALDITQGAVGRPTTKASAALAYGIERDPTGIRRALVGVQRRLGKLDEALVEARKAFGEAQSDPRALATLLSVLEAMGDTETAMDIAERFVAQNPSNQLGVLALMDILAGRGRVDDAVARGTSYLSRQGSDPRVEQEIIAIYRNAGRSDEAEKFAFSGPREALPDAPVVFAVLDIYIAGKKSDETFALAEKILQENTLEPSIAIEVFGRIARGLALDEAEGFYNRYTAAHGDDMAATYGFARVVRSYGQRDRAGDLFVKLAEKGTHFPDVYEVAARRLTALGDAYRAAGLLLSGADNGFLAHPEPVAFGIADVADDPAALAGRLAADEAKYVNAGTLLFQMVARLYSRAGQDANAEEFYRKALSSSTPQLADYAGLIISLYRQDKDAQAIELIEDLRKKGLGTPAFGRLLGTMLARKGDIERALSVVRGLIREKPTDVDNHMALVNVYMEMGDYSAAESQLAVAADLAEGDEEGLSAIRYLLGIVYEEQGRDELALSMWQANLARDSEEPDSNNAIAYHYSQRGINLDEARKFVEKALQIDEENPAYLDTLGWIYYKMGEYTSAVEVLSRAADKLNDPTIFDHLGDAFLAAGDMASAVESWRKALASNPKERDRGEIERKIAGNSTDRVAE